MKLLLSVFLGAVLLTPIGTSFGQLEDIITDTVKIGNTALWIEIADNKVYVTNPEDGRIVILDSDTNEIINNIDTGQGVVIVEVVEEKNKIYATFFQNPSVHVFDLDTGEKLKEIDIGEANVTLYSKSDKPYGQREYITFDTNALGMAYNPNTELLYAVHSTVNHVNIIDTKTDTNLGDIEVGKTPLLIALDTQRNIGYVSNWESNNVSVIDLASEEEIKTLATGLIPDQLVIDQNNNKLFVSHHASPQVTVVDLRTQEIQTKIQLKAPTHSLALDPARNILHVSYMPQSGMTQEGLIGAVEFIDTKTNEVIQTLNLDANPFYVAIDSQRDKLYATHLSTGTVRIVELAHEDTTLELGEAQETVQDNPVGGGCLIATATYGSELSPQVQQLRELRDSKLLQTEAGTSFMDSFNSFYYSFSPQIGRAHV